MKGKDRLEEMVNKHKNTGKLGEKYPKLLEYGLLLWMRPETCHSDVTFLHDGLKIFCLP